MKNYVPGKYDDSVATVAFVRRIERTCAYLIMWGTETVGIQFA